MKTIKRLSFLLLLTLVFSCSKSDTPQPDNESYIKVKRNGTWVMYNSHAIAYYGEKMFEPGKMVIDIGGINDVLDEVIGLYIEKEGTSLSTGTFHSDQLTNGTVEVTLNQKEFTLDGRDYEVKNAPGREPSKYTINITSITPTHISGNFTGNYLYDFPKDDDGTIGITEGEFKVLRLQ
jgi:hypothetical protein